MVISTVTTHLYCFSENFLYYSQEAVLGSQRPALDVVPGATDREPINSETDPAPGKALSSEDSSVSNSNLVFGYLNLFSDGVVSL